MGNGSKAHFETMSGSLHPWMKQKALWTVQDLQSGPPTPKGCRRKALTLAMDRTLLTANKKLPGQQGSCMSHRNGLLLGGCLRDCSFSQFHINDFKRITGAFHPWDARQRAGWMPLWCLVDIKGQSGCHYGAWLIIFLCLYQTKALIITIKVQA